MIAINPNRTDTLIDALTALWEASVRATHHFLTEDDIQRIKPFVKTGFDFKKLVAILRLAVPYTGLIMTARESAAIRDEVIELGVSQIDAGPKLEIDGYKKAKSLEQELNKENFQLGDTRA